MLRSQQNAGLQTNSSQNGQPMQMPLAQQQYLAQQNAAYAQQAAPYMINTGQDGNPYMAPTILTGVPQAYYGVAPWMYQANLIPQQGSQPRRPLTPSQQGGEQPYVSISNLTPFCLSKIPPFIIH